MPNLIIDRVGERFGRWTVLALHPERSRFGKARWVCRCDCGSERIVYGNSLRRGETTSCGCARLVDLTGQRFGRWQVLALHPERKRQGRYYAIWLCRCDCGSEGIVVASKLRSGWSKSCGCLRRETTVKRNTKHGLSHTRAYQVWRNMKVRCFNPRYRDYSCYGGRGITVCERWLILENFYADMGDPPPGMSLDRIDPDGNYQPGNCRWATAAEQIANRRPQQKWRRKRSSLAALQAYVAVTQRSEAASREAAQS